MFILQAACFGSLSICVREFMTQMGMSILKIVNILFEYEKIINLGQCIKYSDWAME